MKGHRKSRRGCHNCKIRKVKCSEDQPTCSGCARQNLSCVYPDLYINATHQDRSAITSRASLHRTIGTDMNPEDQLLFQHFLRYARPRVPLGSDQVWVLEVAPRAHHSSTLMHAVLGVGASHLIAIQGFGVTSTVALWHRQMAMEGIQKAISGFDEETSIVEIESMLAASYALAQQCSNMDDAVGDSIALYRGCETLAKIAVERRQRTSSQPIFRDCGSQLDRILDGSSALGLNTVDRGIAQSMRASLLTFKELCHEEPFSELHEGLVDIATGFCEDWRRGVEAFGRIWEYTNTIPRGEAAQITNPESPVSRLICAHFLVVTVLYDRFRIASTMEMARYSPVQMPISWILSLCDTLYSEPAYRAMVKWPRQVASVAQRIPRQTEWLPVASLWEFVAEEPESFY